MKKLHRLPIIQGGLTEYRVHRIYIVNYEKGESSQGKFIRHFRIDQYTYTDKHS